MSHSQFHSIKRLYLDMHGLIFETSVWLLAESTRLLSLARVNGNSQKRESTTTRFLVRSLSQRKLLQTNNTKFHRISYHCLKRQSNTVAEATAPNYLNSEYITTQISTTNFLILRSGQAWSERFTRRYFSPIKHASHMPPLDVRCTRWNPAR